MPRPTPLPTLVLLVRHGMTPTTGRVLPGRAPGLHLADAGRSQAQALADRLAAWALAPSRTRRASRSRPPNRAGRVAAVYSSPLERTRETATPIATTLDLGVKVERGLLECDYGEWTGAELKALRKLPEWTTVQRAPSAFRFPGGESMVGMQARMVETLRGLCARHPGAVIVAVSHADPIKAAVAHALGTHLDLFQRIVISPCSLTAISYDGSGPTVLTVNATGSLGDLLPAPPPARPAPGRRP
jgi:probable phosphomutase (TIGR03848 family)